MAIRPFRPIRVAPSAGVTVSATLHARLEEARIEHFGAFTGAKRSKASEAMLVFLAF